MIIKFKLQGVDREIKYDGRCFHALEPGTDRAIGYYSSLQNAILRHIKEASITEETGTDEVIELKDYILRLELLFDNVRGLSDEEIKRFTIIGEARPAMTDEHREKIKQGRIEGLKKRSEQAKAKEEPSAFEGF